MRNTERCQGGRVWLFVTNWKVAGGLLLLLLGLGFIAQSVWAEEGRGQLINRLRDKAATVQGENLEVNLLLRGICRQADVNVIVDESIVDTISLDLRNVSLYDVFLVVMDAKKLRFHELNNTLVVEKADALKKDGRDLIMVRLCTGFGDVTQHLKELEVVKSDIGTITLSSDGNCMIVKDHKENVERIRELLTKLDRPTPQVHIKARIVSMEKSVSRQLGIKWGYNDLSRAPANTLAAGTDLSVVNPTTSILFGFIRDNWTLDAELSAMQEKKQLRLLSAPRIVVLDGQKAEIKQGKEIPYETTGTDNTAATTSFREALLSLAVTPKILHNNFIRLDVKVTNDSVDSTQSSSNSQPLLNKQEIQTNLLLEDGVPVVIGGILTKDSDLGNQEVPWLADIPLLGNLFRSKDKLEKTYELLVFLTPTIIKAEHGYQSRKTLSGEGINGTTEKKLITLPYKVQTVESQYQQQDKGQKHANDTEQDPFSLKNEQFKDPDPEQKVSIKSLILE
jgi:type II secretory pathway component HofQ